MSTVQDVSREVMDGLEEHAFSETSREVGGILVGRFSDEGVVVEAALPALRAVGGQTNVTFTHEVWEDVLTAVERDHPQSRIVGWYHSHPGFGLFLSDYDVFIQRNFFSDPRMVALVVDPLAGESGWFGWDGDDVVLRQRRPTERAALRADGGSGSPGSASRRRSAPSLALVAPALLLLGAIGGYVVAGPGESSGSDGDTRLDSVIAQRDEAVAEARRLQARLDATGTGGDTAAGGEGAVVLSYRVRAGDSLWSLSEVFYGDGARFGRITGANPGLAPGALRVGQEIDVPLDGRVRGGGSR